MIIEQTVGSSWKSCRPILQIHFQSKIEADESENIYIAYLLMLDLAVLVLLLFSTHLDFIGIILNFIRSSISQ